MPTHSSRRFPSITIENSSFSCFREGSHPSYVTQCEKFTPQLKAACENGSFSHPEILVAYELSSKMSFLGRDEHKFSQEKVLMKSLNKTTSIHHHDDQNHG
jgi:hypothetical protein